MNNNSSISSGEIGNTRQISPCIHWFFTFNNPTLEDKANMAIWSSDSSIKNYVYQMEIGEKTGTPHFQGYVSFKTKMRPMSVFKTHKIKWEISRDAKACVKYCSKEKTSTGELYTNMKLPKKIKILNDDQLYKWQLDIIDIIKGEADDRLIYWYWENIGNVGKSTFCKYLCIKYGAILVSGKSADIKHVISEYTKINKEYPQIILLDIPRTSADFMSYEALESVKNGCFFSGKYEGGMCIGNCPHIICFSNSPPIINNMSLDRWHIINITEAQPLLLEAGRGPSPPVHEREISLYACASASHMGKAQDPLDFIPDYDPIMTLRPKNVA